jgi:hypothetical protein
MIANGGIFLCNGTAIINAAVSIVPSGLGVAVER